MSLASWWFNQEINGVNILEFLRDKAKTGDVIKVRGSRNSVGIICSYTPASGKTFYAIYFEIRHTENYGNSSTSKSCDVNANWDGTLDETLRVQSGASSEAANKKIDYMGGKSLVGDGTKKVDLTLANINGTPEVEGIIYG